MNQGELRALVNRATFLHERRSANWNAAFGQGAQPLAQTWLARWCQLAAAGDWNRFQQRLAWADLTTATALPLLTDGHWAANTTLPVWAELVAAACKIAPLAPADRLTCRAVVDPFVVVAEHDLAQRVGPQLTWLTTAAQQQLAAHLRQQLVEMVSPTLTYLENVQGPFLPRRGTVYRAPTCAAICQAFPVLARQLATKVSQWVEACMEFLQRLAMDWPLLAAEYGWAAAPTAGVITALRPGLSDPHLGGRTVWAVTMGAACGCETTVAYKPKALGMDRALNELLTWCNAQGLTPPLAHLWTLPRSGYGWMAWAAGEAGIITNNTEHYYQRVGMVLGLLQLLHATDCHAENLVTVGDHLLLVDAEMVCYPQVAGQADADPLDVLRTGLLPRWLVNTQGVAEIGGFSGTNLDDAAIEAIATGYGQLLRFLAHHWPELSVDIGPLAAFHAGEVRFGPRPTAAYLRLLDHLRQPAYLRNGIDFSMGAEQLARTYLANSTHGQFWPLLAQEQTALAQGDVPRFTVSVGQTEFVLGQTIIDAPLRWPAPTLPSAPVQRQQRQLIVASLQRTPYLAPAQPMNHPLLTHAIQLGEILLHRAVPLGDGTLGWIAPQWQPLSGCYQPGFVGDDLYTGRTGIALFLAALYRVTGDGRWRDSARAALPRPGAKAPCDPSGQLYAYSQCAALLGEPELYDHAAWFTQQHLTTVATTPRAKHSSAWGVLDGLAGQLLGLLRCYQQLASVGIAQQRPHLLPMAIAYGDTLCTQQALWCDPTTSLGGFAHGAAGIAYALATLSAICGEHRFLVAAQQGWSLQQQLYDEVAGQWQDRRGAMPVYLDNWCNGAAGIGLAAAGSVALFPTLQPTVERAATLLMSAPPLSPLDTLCCGRFGQIESLLEMGILMAQPNWIAQAISQTHSALAQAEAAGYFQLYDDLPPQLFNPTFFRGIAGIGYTLLRLAVLNGESDQPLPCILRWAADGPCEEVNATGSTLSVESRVPTGRGRSASIRAQSAQ